MKILFLLLLFALSIKCEITYLSNVAYAPYYDSGNSGPNAKNISCMTIQYEKTQFVSIPDYLKSECASCKERCLIVIRESSFPGKLEYETTKRIDCAIYETNNRIDSGICGHRYSFTSHNVWIDMANTIMTIYIIMAVYCGILSLVCILFLARLIIVFRKYRRKIDVCSILCIMLITFQRFLYLVYVSVDLGGISHIIPRNISRSVALFNLPFMIVVTIAIANKYAYIILSMVRSKITRHILNMFSICTSILLIIICTVGAFLSLMWHTNTRLLAYNIFTSMILTYFVSIFHIILTGIEFLLIEMKVCHKNRSESYPNFYRSIIYKVSSISILQFIIMFAPLAPLFNNIYAILSIDIIIIVVYGLINMLQLSIFSKIIKEEKKTAISNESTLDTIKKISL